MGNDEARDGARDGHDGARDGTPPPPGPMRDGFIPADFIISRRLPSGFNPFTPNAAVPVPSTPGSAGLPPAGLPVPGTPAAAFVPGGGPAVWQTSTFRPAGPAPDNLPGGLTVPPTSVTPVPRVVPPRPLRSRIPNTPASVFAGVASEVPWTPFTAANFAAAVSEASASAAAADHPAASSASAAEAASAAMRQSALVLRENIRHVRSCLDQASALLVRAELHLSLSADPTPTSRARAHARTSRRSRSRSPPPPRNPPHDQDHDVTDL